MSVLSPQETMTMAYRNDDYLQIKPLTIRNLFTEYFNYSPFYDPNSLNEQVHRYDTFTDLFLETGITYRLTYVQIQYPEFLKTLDPQNPPQEKILDTEEEIYKESNLDYPIFQGLSVISKINSTADAEGRLNKELLAQYYMIDGTVYQAPDLYSLVTSNFRTSIFNLREAILLSDSLYQWTPELRFQQIGNNISIKPPYIFSTLEMSHIFDECNVERNLQNFFVDQVVQQVNNELKAKEEQEAKEKEEKERKEREEKEAKEKEEKERKKRERELEKSKNENKNNTAQ